MPLDGADVFGIDDLTIGMAPAVPEPASLALLGAGVFGAAACYVCRERNLSRLA